MYCNTMELTDVGTYSTKKPDLPDVCAHYDDEALNIYETIPMDHESKMAAKAEPLDEDEYCVPRCSTGDDTHDHSGRCCNEYVEAGNYA